MPVIAVGLVLLVYCKLTKIVLYPSIVFASAIVFAENINIQAENISINKDKEISIFRDNVSIQDNEFNSIKSNFAEYNKKEKYLLIKGNIEAIDKYENILTAQEIEYDLNKKIKKQR